MAPSYGSALAQPSRAVIFAERTRERDVSAGETQEQTTVHALTASLAPEQALAATLRLDLARAKIGTQMAITLAGDSEQPPRNAPGGQ